MSKAWCGRTVLYSTRQACTVACAASKLSKGPCGRAVQPGSSDASVQLRTASWHQQHPCRAGLRSRSRAGERECVLLGVKGSQGQILSSRPSGSPLMLIKHHVSGLFSRQELISDGWRPHAVDNAI